MSHFIHSTYKSNYQRKKHATFNCIYLIKPALSLPVSLVQQSLQTLNANGVIEMQSMPALCRDPSLHAASEYKAQRCMHTLWTNSLYSIHTQFVFEDVRASLSFEIYSLCLFALLWIPIKLTCLPFPAWYLFCLFCYHTGNWLNLFLLIISFHPIITLTLKQSKKNSPVIVDLSLFYLYANDPWNSTVSRYIADFFGKNVPTNLCNSTSSIKKIKINTL